jgi:hypothetical protein
VSLVAAAPAMAITIQHADQVANRAIRHLGAILQARYHQKPTSYHGHCHLQGTGARCPFNIHFKSGKVCHSTVVIKEPGDHTSFGKVHCVH